MFGSDDKIVFATHPCSLPDSFTQFLQHCHDFDLYHANKPSEADYRVLRQYPGYNDMVWSLLTGWFGGYRKGLISPPAFSIWQSLRNLFMMGDVKKVIRSDSFAERLAALKRLHNCSMLSKRIRSDGESEILNAISGVAHGECDQAVEIVGIRLLDGYYKKAGSDRARRVILGSPLYLASSFSPW